MYPIAPRPPHPDRAYTLSNPQSSPVRICLPATRPRSAESARQRRARAFQHYRIHLPIPQQLPQHRNRHSQQLQQNLLSESAVLSFKSMQMSLNVLRSVPLDKPIISAPLRSSNLHPRPPLQAGDSTAHPQRVKRLLRLVPVGLSAAIHVDPAWQPRLVWSPKTTCRIPQSSNCPSHPSHHPWLPSLASP